ncbi:MAG: peptide chain release factor aRF-1 [Candidatus Woesearchaeota archaeon]
MKKISAAQRYKLRNFIKHIEEFRGRNTELVTVYVPSGYDINKILTHLSQEQGTAGNIKSKSTQKNVIDALERMIQHLKLFNQTPPNGLAAFAGNVAEKEGQSDVKVWSIEPPVPINTRVYRCDKEFHLDILRDLAETKDIYGLVVMDRRDGDVGFLKGKSIIPAVSTHSNVPGKTRAGGQSAQRFERLREGAAIEFYKRIADYMKEQFLENKDIKGILIGGPGRTKNDLIDGNYINNELKQKIIAIRDLSYTGEFGLQELVDKCEDTLANEDIAEEKSAMNDFFTRMAKEPAKVSYGKAQVMELLKQGAVDTLIISEELDEHSMEEFDKEAKNVGTTVKIISTETREGIQLKNIGMVGAILRFAIE